MAVMQQLFESLYPLTERPSLPSSTFRRHSRELERRHYKQIQANRNCDAKLPIQVETHYTEHDDTKIRTLNTLKYFRLDYPLSLDRLLILASIQRLPKYFTYSCSVR